MEVTISQKVQEHSEQVFNVRLNSEVFKHGKVAQLPALAHGISRMSPTDADLFRDAFQRESICYANSWLYLLRSTRNDEGDFGYKFVGEGTLAGIGYRHHSVYIVRPIGAGRFQMILDLCSRIYESLQCPIILKKIDRALYEQLSATQLFQAHADDLTLFEEEAFPEHILQLEHLYSPLADRDQRSLSLLKKVRRFEKSMKLLPEQDVYWEDLESNAGFQNLFGDNPGKYKSYKQIIREASSFRARDGKYKVCAYYDERHAVHGLYISELFEKGSMGLYCAVSSKSSPGITEWMDYDFFRQLFQEGIHTLYLGGSETEGVDAYIKKLLPIAPSYLMRPMLMHCEGALSV